MSVVQSCMRGRFHKNCGVVPSTGHTVGPLIRLYLRIWYTKKASKALTASCVIIHASIGKLLCRLIPRVASAWFWLWKIGWEKFSTPPDMLLLLL